MNTAENPFNPATPLRETALSQALLFAEFSPSKSLSSRNIIEVAQVFEHYLATGQVLPPPSTTS